LSRQQPAFVGRMIEGKMWNVGSCSDDASGRRCRKVAGEGAEFLGT
jgi:hypothetical protein